MFGVCCDHPNVLDPEGNHKEDGSHPPPAVIMPPNWPPPLPTHPPDHTVPPVPTYPPSTTSAKPPTLPPWPPQQQQHNFTIITNRPPSTTAPTSNVEIVGSDGFHFQCGLKNGPQDQERIVGGQNADPGEWPWIVSTHVAINRRRDVEWKKG